jgi:hypothetical protein
MIDEFSLTSFSLLEFGMDCLEEFSGVPMAEASISTVMQP